MGLIAHNVNFDFAFLLTKHLVSLSSFMFCSLFCVFPWLSLLERSPMQRWCSIEKKKKKFMYIDYDDKVTLAVLVCVFVDLMYSFSTQVNYLWCLMCLYN